jgi:hypothetical protein
MEETRMKKLLIGAALMMITLGAAAPVLADCGADCASSCSSSTGKAYEDCMLNCLNDCLDNDPPQVPDVPAPTPVEAE